MNKKNCPLCGGLTTLSHIKVPYYENPKNVMDYEEYGCCKFCKQTVFITKKELDGLYDKNYTGFRISGWRGVAKYIFSNFRAKKYSKVIKGKNILEVGCGTGHFLESAQHFKPKFFWGTEISKSAVKASRCKQNITCLPFETFITKEKFDTIFLFHVIEHFKDPIFVIKKCMTMLKPNGCLVIETPNYQSWDRRIFGTNWFNWSVPYHHWIFSEPSLTLLLNKYKFDIVSTTFSKIPNTFTYQFRFLKNPIHKILMPIYWGAYAVEYFIASLFSASDVFTLVAKKPNYDHT